MFGDRLAHGRRGIRDGAVDQEDARAVGRGLAPDDLGRVPRHDHDDADAGPCAVRGPRRSGVARGREREGRDLELASARHAHGRTAGFERAGRKQTLVLDEELVQADLLA